MDLKKKIQRSLEIPDEVEAIFRSSDEDEFKGAIFSLLENDSSNILLQCWKARFEPDRNNAISVQFSQNSNSGNIIFVVLLCLFAGIYTKLPALLTFIDSSRFYSANTPFFLFSALILFFAVRNKIEARFKIIIAASFLLCLIYLNIYSVNYVSGPGPFRTPDSYFLSSLHMPFVLWTILGLCFMGGNPKDYLPRINFLSYNGEVLIYSGIILICGIFMTFLTFGLFSVINVNIHNWYMEWVVVFGIVSAPIVATYIVVNRFVMSGKIAPLLARIFSPLFLITLVGYLVAAVFQGKNPLVDRDFLLVFNCMLIAVLCIAVFGIVERPASSRKVFTDYLNTGLIAVALLINLVALGAIIFRLVSYGLTPNRVSVLGSNVLIFIHLCMLLRSNLKLLAGKGTVIEIHKKVADYLPVYSAWSIFVVFILPAIFLYK